MFDLERTKLSEPAKDYIREKYDKFCLAKTFVPNRPQYEYIHAVGSMPLDPEDPKSIFIVKSANGVGKTSGTWNILANIIYGNEKNKKGEYGPVNIFNNKIIDMDTGEEIDGFFTEPLYNGKFPKKWPKNILYTSNKDVLNAIWEEAKVWLPKNDFEEFWEESKDGKNYISKVSFLSTNWTLFFKTIDQEPKTFEGANISIYVFDEPPPRPIFSACVRGMRMGGFALMPATPLKDEPWFPEYCEEPGNPDMWLLEVNIWSNCIEKAGQWDMGDFGIQDKGNLTQRTIEMMIRQWERIDPDLLPARVEGKSVHLTGIVYKSYVKYRDKIFTDFTIWVREPELFMYRFILDPHDRRPPAAIWQKMNRKGDIWTLREFPSKDDIQYQGKPFVEINDAGHYTLKDFVKFFMAIERELQIPKNRIQDIIDPNFGLKRNMNTGKRVFEEYTDASRELLVKEGFGREYSFIYNVLDSLDEGHSIVRQLIIPDAIDKHHWFIHKSCFNCDQQMRYYRRKRQTIKDEEEHGLTDKVALKFKDYPDLFRYSAVVPWDYIDLPRNVDRYTGDDYGEITKPADRSQIPEEYDWRQQLREITRPEGADGA